MWYQRIITIIAITTMPAIRSNASFFLFYSRTMYHTVDSTEVNMGPIRDYKIHMSIYYVCFVVVFAFFFINIFVALIIVTFQESGERNIQASDLDRNQVNLLLWNISFVWHSTKHPQTCWKLLILPACCNLWTIWDKRVNKFLVCLHGEY